METQSTTNFQHDNNAILPGDRGDTVTGVQRLLSLLGYAIKATGDFDRSTEFAVRAFQQKNGIFASGIVDTETKAKFVEVIQAKQASSGLGAVPKSVVQQAPQLAPAVKPVVSASKSPLAQTKPAVVAPSAPVVAASVQASTEERTMKKSDPVNFDPEKVTQIVEPKINLDSTIVASKSIFENPLALIALGVGALFVIKALSGMSALGSPIEDDPDELFADEDEED